MVAEVNKLAGIQAAQIAGRSSEMDRVAERLAALARAGAGNDTTFAGSIRVRNVAGKRGVRDRLVEATDPLAAPKELGHVVRNRADGPVLGYVKGRHAMRNAVRDIPEVRE